MNEIIYLQVFRSSPANKVVYDSVLGHLLQNLNVEACMKNLARFYLSRLYVLHVVKINLNIVIGNDLSF